MKQQVLSVKDESDLAVRLGVQAVDQPEQGEGQSQFGRALDERFLGETGQLILVEASNEQIAAIVADLTSDDRISVSQERMENQLAEKTPSLYFKRPAASSTSCVSMPTRSKIIASSLTRAILTSRCVFSMTLAASATLMLEALWVPAVIIDR